ncbi:hypothetical protein E1293_20115 [Actinomadura darangshiensis]|uniref:Secreted protein n=1 Tax=Actinomadura darangshiensis TaxID=705336 RepID=A0A4R5B770_9ACTN|nr:hypothetical protein [Actinomadura darangshiensis]TDD80749.1 hypothetical protein E1293_20115 [Actinomadura darangshiensis]
MFANLRMLAVTGAMTAITVTPLLSMASAQAATAPTPPPRGDAQATTDAAPVSQSVGRALDLKSRKCVSTTGSTACFETYGDKFYVKDTKKDGYSAVAVWATSYGRKGVCRNSLGSGKWGVCNYNMKEGKGIAWLAERYNGNTGKFIGPKSKTATATI